MNPRETAIRQLGERFRREAGEKREETIGRTVCNLIQIHGDVSFRTIRLALCDQADNSPSERGEIRPELDPQLHDAREALLLLLELHEPHDG